MRAASAFAGALFLAGMACNANAAVVSITSQDIADFAVNPGSVFTAPTSQTPPLTVTFPTTSSDSITRSPFENTDKTPGPGYGNQYVNIPGGTTAVWDFDSSNALTILWGSPDTYNTLTFWSAAGGTGTNLGSFTGADLLINSVGHDIVTFLADPGWHFLSVSLVSDPSNAFEFTNMLASCTDCEPRVTPLPAALPLFASAFAGVGGLLGWRKRRKAKSAALVPAAA